MAVTGTYSDRFLTLFTDNLLMELQQEGSRLVNIFPKKTAKGQKTYIDKIGLTTSHQKTARLQRMTPDEETYERRLITFEKHYAFYIPDDTDLLDMVQDPTSDLLRSMAFQLGRKMDDIILTALKGNAVVQTNGSTTNTALPAGQKIAVSNISYDPDLSAGDKALTPGKLLLAKKLLDQNYNNGDYVVIAPAGQLAALMTSSRVSSADFRTVKPLESAGLDRGLDGLHGMHFIMYEETGVDSNSDELVFVCARNALQCLERNALTTKIAPMVDMVGHPQGLHSFFDMGATRMYEEAVVQISCDPRKS
jgi:hypothetical protein